MQRVSSDLRLNPHLRAIVIDGVFAPNNDSVVLHPLARLDDSGIADLLQVIRVRVVNFLVRKGIVVLRPLPGVVESRDEFTLLDNADDADPSLIQLAMAAVSGSIPAGPCVESYAGTRGLLRKYAELGGKADEILPIAEAARRGEKAGCATFEAMGEALGIGLAAIQNTLDLDAIIFTGGISASFDLIEPA